MQPDQQHIQFGIVSGGRCGGVDTGQEVAGQSVSGRAQVAWSFESCGGVVMGVDETVLQGELVEPPQRGDEEPFSDAAVAAVASEHPGGSGFGDELTELGNRQLVDGSVAPVLAGEELVP